MDKGNTTGIWRAETTVDLCTGSYDAQPDQTFPNWMQRIELCFRQY